MRHRIFAIILASVLTTSFVVVRCEIQEGTSADNNAIVNDNIALSETIAYDNKTHEHHNITDSSDHGHGITLVSWRWDDYSDYVVVCIMILVAGIVKVIFHETPILSKHFPESCNLIFLGILVGLFVYYGVESHSHHFPQ